MIDNASGEPSFDIVVKIEYKDYKHIETKIPFLFYTALNPNKGFNSYMPKFKLIPV